MSTFTFDEIEQLRDALQWYAEKENYATGQDCPDVLIDGGDLARRTLEQSAADPMEYTSIPLRDVQTVKTTVTDLGRSEPLPVLQDRNDAIRAAIFAALTHHKPDYRGPTRLDKSAKVIADFVIGALDDLSAHGENETKND